MESLGKYKGNGDSRRGDLISEELVQCHEQLKRPILYSNLRKNWVPLQVSQLLLLSKQVILTLSQANQTLKICRTIIESFFIAKIFFYKFLGIRKTNTSFLSIHIYELDQRFTVKQFTF